MRQLSDDEVGLIRGLYNVTDSDVDALKAIEFRGWNGIPATNHDVKAIEYFMKKRLEDTSLKDVLEWIHLPLTSEDTNSVSYGLMLSDALGKVIIPKLNALSEKIGKSGSLGEEYKEMLDKEIEVLKKTPALVKFNGAVGNYNAHNELFPNLGLQGLLQYTKDFVSVFNEGRAIPLKPNLITTQIEPHDNLAKIFNALKRANTAIEGFVRAIREDRELLSSGIMERFKEMEVSLDAANSLSSFFSAKLPISRLQRDLSDSTVERNLGVALGYCQVGYSLLSDALDLRSRFLHLEDLKESKTILDVIRDEDVASPTGELGLSRSLNEIVIPKIKELRNAIGAFAKQYTYTVMPGRTHGQIAVPTTMGKEKHNDEERLSMLLKDIEESVTSADSEAELPGRLTP